MLNKCQWWDSNMDSGPVATFQVHEYLRPKQSLSCLVVLREAMRQQFLEASKNLMSRQVQTPSRPSKSLGGITCVVRRGAESPSVDANGNSFDFTTKLLHLAWHTTENSSA
ncbi:hypothetical protein SLEP1_g43943 [Rubroshorea leprosula]|uniref:Uncharacterized protein n=1 Tax=Rubroshorea leprosula TaxID=152421 RepID=A0AAV5LEQ2_9ROSI|nr:hypothetical protein SLEP1_g43943 [Rubroshorea leprosula]